MTRSATTRRGIRPSGLIPLLAALCLALPLGPAGAQDAPKAQSNVTISTRDMPLQEFLELLSVSCKLNMVCPKDLTGKVSANFHEVPALDVLKAVLEANSYEYHVEETAGRSIIKIRTKTAAKKVTEPQLTVNANGNVTVSAQNMPLPEFVELLALNCKLNIVCPKDLTGSVSANLADAPPLDVLRTVLEANGYMYTTDEAKLGIIKIQKARTAPAAAADEEPLVIRTIVLRYATADDVSKVAEKLLTKRGSISTAAGKNAVVLQDVAASVKNVEEVITQLDATPRQVTIDCKIVEIGKTDLEEKGFNWSMFQNMKIADITAEASYARAATWTATKATGAATTDVRNIVRTTGTNVDLRAGILAENQASLIIDFFDTMTDTKIISRPSIRTVDNKSAHIVSGQIVPIPLFDFAKDTGVRTLSGFQEEQIGVELTVTPHINDDGYITLEVNPKVESIDRYIQVNGDDQRPVKNTRQANTTIRIKDGETAVIGGLTASTTLVTTTGLPFLKDLPFVGWIFTHTTTDVNHTELLIFINPKTVEDGAEKLSDDQKKLIQEVEQKQIIK